MVNLRLSLDLNQLAILIQRLTHISLILFLIGHLFFILDFVLSLQLDILTICLVDCISCQVPHFLHVVGIMLQLLNAGRTD